MVVIGVIAGAIALVVALAIQWLPDSASEEMDRIAFVYWFATAISIAIFAVVAGALVYIVWAFRAAPDDTSDGPPVHGNSTLEVVWTAVPAILVVAIGIVSAVALSRNADAGENPLTIKVVAAQFAWYFEYPDAGGARSNELVMPVDRGIEFELQSKDVIHSFWIPEMGQKQDVVPGVTTTIVVTPTRTGDFALVCTELCGLGHSTMRAPARVVDASAFETFLAGLREEGSDGGSGGSGGSGGDGAAVFAEAGCGGCHAFTPAGTTMEIGPNLDEVAAAAEAAGQPLDVFIREAIVEPGKTVAEGYQDGVMPSTYGDTLTPEQLDALVQYLEENA